MSIRVACPNGHKLNVKDSWAGMSGLCPVCKARIKVPVPAASHVSEDDILAFLGPHEPSRKAAVAYGGDDFSHGGEDDDPEHRGPPKKICDMCNREIDAATHICPYCRTYIAGLRDI